VGRSRALCTAVCSTFRAHHSAHHSSRRARVACVLKGWQRPSDTDESRVCARGASRRSGDPLKKVAPLPEEQDGRAPSIRPEMRDAILYVEDDDENWDVAEYRLSRAYNMLRAPTSERACHWIRERGSSISLILMDIELRGSELNGTELTELFRGRQLRRPLPDYAHNLPLVTKPIIFVTAHGARYSDVELMLFGADMVIAKPVNFAALNLALTSLQLSHANRRR
jgi:CheY-like chemotaxis protein